MNGIFPWYGDDDPILWHSPPLRFVVRPEDFRVGRTIQKAQRRAPFALRYDTDFRGTIRGCQRAPREGQAGTWITEEMLEAYVEMHELGYAHSAEAWQDGVLVGGLYGIALGSVFFGESMFSDVDDASKVVFATLGRWLFDAEYTLIDSQVYTDHVSRFGGVEIPRARYLEQLSIALKKMPRAVWPRG